MNPEGIDVLIDSDTVSEGTEVFKALNVLLSTRGIHHWRYAHEGPPESTQRDERTAAPRDWAVALAPSDESNSRRRTLVTHIARRFDGTASTTNYIHGKRSNPRSPSELLGEVAFATEMAILVTNRQGVSLGSWPGLTLVQTPEQAVATLGLLLRGMGIFPVLPNMFVRRSMYLWLSLDSLIPHYGDWAGACSVDALPPSPGEIYTLSSATEGRLFQTLNARDQVGIAMSQHRVDWSDVADATDRFLVFLLATMDTTARAVNEISGGLTPPEKAKWQSDTFRKALDRSHPRLAAIFNDGSRGRDVHLVLRKLRNTIHGGSLTMGHTLLTDGHLDRPLSVPAREVPGLMAAVDRLTSDQSNTWGLHQTHQRVFIEPNVLVEALTHEGFTLLDQIFALSPVPEPFEPDPAPVTIDVDQPDSEPEFLRLMLETRGSEMYLWHLGMHPQQTNDGRNGG